jgi:hypothetical protein
MTPIKRHAITKPANISIILSLLVVIALALFSSCKIQAQTARFDIPVWTINSSSPQPGAVYPMLAFSNAGVQLCSTWNGSGCTAKLQTYTDITGSTPCSLTAQLVAAEPGSACSARADASGGVGGFTQPGTYAYFISTGYGTFGPYVFQVAGLGGANINNQAVGVIPLPTASNVIGAQSHLDDGVTTPGTITSSEPFNASQVNTVYDLVAAFGASGSQQTMTCTATATVASLASCSGGDFKSGQWVYIQGAGGLPTISAPTSPTLTCGVDNIPAWSSTFSYGLNALVTSGGSTYYSLIANNLNNTPASNPSDWTVGSGGTATCPGTFTYGYQIVAVQGAPNGAMTAASTAVTITQAPQLATAPPGSGRPDAYTSVNWPGVTGATVYLVYKSINGGPYTFYTYFTSGTHSFLDHGYWSAYTFTCVDLAVPCSPPASPVPNDVFATIAGSGSSWTLSALPYPPMYQNGTPLNGSSTYPFTPATSGTFTIQHDDTPAFQKAWNYITNTNGRAELHIPSGNFNLHSEDPYGRAGSVMHLNNLNHFILSGNGEASKLFQSNDRSQRIGNFLDGVCGFGSLNPPGSCQTLGSNVGGGTFYSVVDPVPLGAYSVTMSTPSDASNFSPGTYVSLGANASIYPQRDYQEMNLVTASDPTTGIVTLAYPTTKPYSTTLPVPYNNCTACQAAPVMGPVLPIPVATFITLRDFWYRGANQFLNINTIDNIDEENLTLEVASGEVEGFVRHRKIQGVKEKEDSPYGVATIFGDAAQSSSDYIVTGNIWSGHTNTAGQWCGEGSANLFWSSNSFTYQGIQENAGGSASNSMLGGFGSLCYGYTYVNNTVNISQGNAVAVIAVNDNRGTGTIAHNTINIDKAGSYTAPGPGFGGLNSAINCISNQALTTNAGQIYDNNWNVLNGAGCNGQVSTHAAGLPTFKEVAFQGGTSGSLALYQGYWGNQTILDIGPLTGNITAINFGGTHSPGYWFYIKFIQASSGGPYSLPADCTSAHWVSPSSNGIQCPAGPPILNPASGSSTILTFYDDGTYIYWLGSNYNTTENLSDWSNAGASTNYVATCQTTAAGKCTSWAPAAGAVGGPVLVQSVDRTGLSADVGNTPAFTTPPGIGSYLVTCYTVLTTPDATSSTLPYCYIGYVDGDTGVNAIAAGGTGGNFPLGTTSPGNTISDVSRNSQSPNTIYIHTASSSSISYGTAGYTSNVPGTMQFALHLRIEYIGP